MDPDALVGRHLGGQFRVERLIGRGGCGSVYAATDVVLGRAVAVKLRDGPADPRAEARFRREATAQARLHHPTIVRLLHLGHEEGRPFIVQDLVDGRTLREVVERGGPLTPRDARHLFARLLEGLAGAHAVGVVHRDIKPSNVMIVGERGQQDVRLLDFGVARLLDVPDGERLTSEGAVVGTIDWLSPEQASQAPATPASDQYAVGCLLYYALSGRRPFVGSAIEVLVGHLSAHPEPLPPEVPPDLRAIVTRAMEKSPARRFPSADAMAEALRETAHSVGPHPRPAQGSPFDTPSQPMSPALEPWVPDSGDRERPAIIPTAAAGGHRRGWALAIALLVLVASGGLWATLGLGQPSGERPAPGPAPRPLAVSPLVGTSGTEASIGAPIAGFEVETGGPAMMPEADRAPPVTAVARAPSEIVDAPAPARAAAPAARSVGRGPGSKHLEPWLQSCDCEGARQALEAIDRPPRTVQEAFAEACGRRGMPGGLGACGRSLAAQADAALAECPCHGDATRALVDRLYETFGVDRRGAWSRRCVLPGVSGGCFAR